MQLPRLYPIVDVSRGDSAEAIAAFVKELISGGATFIQYRNKTGTSREILSHSRELQRVAAQAVLLMNDRADLCLAANFNGVHLGQDDLSIERARDILGREHWIGASAHSAQQLREADTTSADYIAIGPVFATASKRNPGPIVGVEGVRSARAATRKPLVAIGGITRTNCRDVMEAGADSVAVISELINSPRKSVEDFLRVLE